jgi:hypothetical protein
MRRKKIIIIALIVALTLIPIFAVLTNSTPAENSQTLPLDDENGPSLVIPESPLGIASLFIACLAALSLFFISKKK